MARDPRAQSCEFPPEADTVSDFAPSSRPPRALEAEPSGERMRRPMRSNTYSIVVPRSAPSETPPRASGFSSRPPAPRASIAPIAIASAQSEEEDDLDDDQKVLFDVTLTSFEFMTHYAVLGIVPESDKNQIRRSFRNRIAQFHPDRYFRKRLGAYRLRLNAIATRLIEAYDVLTNAKRRADYDESLNLGRTSAAMRRTQGEARSKKRAS